MIEFIRGDSVYKMTKAQQESGEGEDEQNNISWCNKAYIPVSYTHLDVYKRQEEPSLLQVGMEEELAVQISVTTKEVIGKPTMCVETRLLLCLLYTSRCV